MEDSRAFAHVVALVSGAGLVAVLSSRITQRLRVPAPLLFLVAAAVVANLSPQGPALSVQTVQRIVTVALACILFEGGSRIGRQRFQAVAGPIVIVGVLGTFLTTVAGAVLAHFVFGLPWYPSVLLATAVAPTDPAVVFSVLGQRGLAGRSVTLLQGESGANDPVGIALLVSLLAAGSLHDTAVNRALVEFCLQLGIGTVLGVLGGLGLLLISRRLTLATTALQPLRNLAGLLLIYGLTTVVHGSGFLAVFVAGIVVGEETAPYRQETAQFLAALASLGEIVAFAVLGLTVRFADLTPVNVWGPGVVLGAALAVAIRPLCVGACLAGSGLPRNERAFVLFAGLKGAVPILLGTLLLTANAPMAHRLFGIVVIVVAFSVLVQGSLIPVVARRLRVPTEPGDHHE